MVEPIEIHLPSGLTLSLWPKRGKWSWMKGQWVEAPETKDELWRRMITILRTTDFSSVIRAYANVPEAKDEPAAKPSRKGKQPENKVAAIKDVLANLKRGQASLPLPDRAAE